MRLRFTSIIRSLPGTGTYTPITRGSPYGLSAMTAFVTGSGCLATQMHSAQSLTPIAYRWLLSQTYPELHPEVRSKSPVLP